MLKMAEEGPVRMRKKTDQPRHTHILEMAEGVTCQDAESNRPTKVHLHPGDSRGRDLSGHGKKPTNRGTLTFWRQQREGLSGHRKKPAERGTLTNWRQQREELCQDMERTQPTKVHSLPGDSRGRDLSEHGKKPTDRSSLTSWRRQR